MAIIERAEQLTKELSFVSLPGDTVVAERRTRSLVPLMTQRVVKLWKYKPRKILKENRFLRSRYRGHRKLYHNVAEEISQCGTSKVILTLEELLTQYETFLNTTRLINIPWDSNMNPLVLVAEGWSFHNFKDEQCTLLCSCKECHKLLSIDLESVDNMHKMIANGFLKEGHTQKCYWRKYSFPLSRDYTLNKNNMLQEYLRIEKTILSGKNIDFEVQLGIQIQPLKDFFKVKDSNLLNLILRGFDIPGDTKDGIIKCKYCHLKSRIDSLSKQDYNGHFSWCRYHDQTQLFHIIQESIANEKKSSDVGDRLSHLEHILITL